MKMKLNFDLNFLYSYYCPVEICTAEESIESGKKSKTSPDHTFFNAETPNIFIKY